MGILRRFLWDSFLLTLLGACLMIVITTNERMKDGYN